MKKLVTSPQSNAPPHTQRRMSLTPYWFLLLPFAFLITFFYYPLLETILLSLTKFRGMGEREYVGLSNYANIIKDPVFQTALKNTLTYTAVVVPALVVFGFALAVLTEQKIRGKNFFKAAYYFPVITSMVAVGITWRMLYNQKGLLNYVLVGLGLIKTGPAWIADISLALPSLMLVTFWAAVGSYMVVFSAGLKDISKELYEAAMIDGANTIQRVRFITIPLMHRYIMMGTVLAIIGVMKVFTEVYVMTQGGPGNATIVLNLQSYFWAFKYFRLGYGASAGVIILIIVLFLTVITIGLFELRGKR